MLNHSHPIHYHKLFYCSKLYTNSWVAVQMASSASNVLPFMNVASRGVEQSRSMAALSPLS